MFQYVTLKIFLKLLHCLIVQDTTDLRNNAVADPTTSGSITFATSNSIVIFSGSFFELTVIGI